MGDRRPHRPVRHLQGPRAGRPVPRPLRAATAAGGTRSRRTGTEPVTARSALRLRLLLSAVYAPLFAAGAVLFRLWSARSGPGARPRPGELEALAGVCTVLAVLALLDLLVVLRRRRRERPPVP